MKFIKNRYIVTRIIMLSTFLFFLNIICGSLLLTGFEIFWCSLILLTGTITTSVSALILVYRPYKVIKSRLNDYNHGYNEDLFLEGNLQLSSSVQDLFHKIQEDLLTEKSLKNTNKQAEYLALQNQINPHFLYNTLEGIRSDALIEGVDNIARIIESLAVYFRYTISKIDRLVTLNEELTNINNYLVIQNYRFGDRMKMEESYDQCDRAICSYFIPKLILQPFIENAIIHGLEEKIGQGKIKIIFSITEKLLLITIEDNGVGIFENDLKKINRNLNRVSGLNNDENATGGIAIKNVNNRIKLLFGEIYGIKIRSIKDFGTSVDIVLPLIKTKDQNRDL